MTCFFNRHKWGETVISVEPFTQGDPLEALVTFVLFFTVKCEKCNEENRIPMSKGSKSEMEHLMYEELIRDTPLMKALQ